MTGRIEAQTATGKIKELEVTSHGKTSTHLLPLRTGGQILVLDGMASNLDSEPEIKTEGAVEEITATGQEGNQIRSFHLKEGGVVVFEQKPGEVVNKRGYVKVAVTQTKDAWQD